MPQQPGEQDGEVSPHTVLRVLLQNFYYSQVRRGALPLAKIPDAAADGEPQADGSEHAGDLTAEDFDPADLSAFATVFQLSSDDDWRQFHDSFAADRFDNLKPWFRCLGILRGHGAVTAVVEHHYVCLDYRSEFAAFYAHLDAPRRSSTVRLHFFSTPVAQEHLLELNSEQKEKYLGYMVLREGDLPLVGRTVIRPPAYVHASTSIREPVNFFGQQLAVVGVPFMQQDQRFAACAHVSAWVAHYSAFRRGLFERRLVADFVDLADGLTPMRPRHAGGLSEQQLGKLLDAVGFRSLAFSTPWTGSRELPAISAGELPEVVDLLPEAAEQLKDADPSFLSPARQRLDVALLAEQALLEYMVTASLESGKGEERVPPHRADSVRAYELFLDHLIRPHVDSGWPVYAGTTNHAVTICGRAHVAEADRHVVHDDQYGPYLIAPTLTFLSINCLRHQSGRYEGTQKKRDWPSVDVLLDEAGKFQESGEFLDIGEDYDRAIHSVVVPLPPRVLLPPIAARRRSLYYLRRLLRNENHLLVHVDEAAATSLKNVRTKVTILMGIDLKAHRRKEAIAAKDDVGRAYYSTVHLAEWVVLVEGLSAEDVSLWEFVFDASSSQDEPRLQSARVLGTALSADPKGALNTTAAQVISTAYTATPVRLVFIKWAAPSMAGDPQ